MADSPYSVCLKNDVKRENHSKNISPKLIQASLIFCENFQLPPMQVRCRSVVSPL